MMNKKYGCLTKSQSKIFRAAVIAAIRRRKIRQRDLWESAGVRPQYLVDILHGDKPISLRMHSSIMRVMRPVFERMAA